MENDIEIQFKLDFKRLSFNGIIPSEENQKYVDNFDLILLIGFTENIKQEYLLKIPINLKETKFNNRYKINRKEDKACCFLIKFS